MEERVLKIYEELKELDICENRGLSNPKESERQFLYGDISDIIRDNYNYLNKQEKEYLARLIIGDYVIKNCLL